jgi:predicted nucleic acid-binding protein
MATPTRTVFDASVVVRAALGQTPAAGEWLRLLREGRITVVAPELVYSEIASAHVQLVRKELITLDQARESLSESVRLPFDVVPNRAMCEAALTVAVGTGLSAYDAHYLALAEAEDAVLVTADRTLAAAASQGVLLE